MKHHSQQELDEKIHAFLTSKAEKFPELHLDAATVNGTEEIGDRKTSLFSPFIALQMTPYSK